MRVETGVSEIARLNLGMKDIRDGIRRRNKRGQSTGTIANKSIAIPKDSSAEYTLLFTLLSIQDSSQP